MELLAWRIRLFSDQFLFMMDVIYLLIYKFFNEDLVDFMCVSSDRLNQKKFKKIYH